MNNRERFFALLEGKELDRTPFFPDITNWYDARRVPPGAPQKYGAGAFIPDDDPYHFNQGSMPEEYLDWTFLDFYRKYDWGLPIHLYGWYATQKDGYEVDSVVEGKNRTTTLKTPKGNLQKTARLAEDGSWGPHEHYVKKIEDLEIIRYMTEHSSYTSIEKKYHQFINATDGYGVCDIPISRSPFGKLVHELMGFEQVIYALMDHEEIILDFLKFQEEYDLEVIRLAAEYPARVVIISDHADENLIAPPYYEKYCIPFYQKACAILHAKGKFVSTHLDGNFKGFFPIIKDTHFDLLDGCTPAPMFNYEVEELAACLGGDMNTYLGVPSTLFTQSLPVEKITEFGQRIIDAFDRRVILNIGDILPPNADVEQVRALGETIN